MLSQASPAWSLSSQTTWPNVPVVKLTPLGAVDDQVHPADFVGLATAVLTEIGHLKSADDVAGSAIAGMGSVGETRLDTATVTVSGAVCP